MVYFLSFVAALLVAAALTWLVRSLTLRYKLMPLPRLRDVHTTPVPRLGGIAIFGSFLVTSFLAYLYWQPTWIFGPGVWFGVDKHLVGIWLGGLSIVLSMVLDDIKGLRPWQKLLFQLAAVFVVIGSGIGIDKLSNPLGQAIDLNSVYLPIFNYGGITYHFSLLSDLLTVIWLVGMMNVINFVDGVDGLASGVSVIAALTIFFLSVSPGVDQPATALAAIIVAGSAAGFLLWNFPPAKIFMGDSGSMFLGYVLGIIAIISGGKLATAFLVLGFPILDGVLVAGGRLLRGENPLTTPDKTHLHHRFLKAGFSVRQSILFLYVISASFGALALRLKTMDKIISGFILIVLLIVLIKVLNYRAMNQRGGYRG